MSAQVTEEATAVDVKVPKEHCVDVIRSECHGETLHVEIDTPAGMRAFVRACAVVP